MLIKFITPTSKSMELHQDISSRQLGGQHGIAENMSKTKRHSALQGRVVKTRQHGPGVAALDGDGQLVDHPLSSKVGRVVAESQRRSRSGRGSRELSRRSHRRPQTRAARTRCASCRARTGARTSVLLSSSSFHTEIQNTRVRRDLLPLHSTASAFCTVHVCQDVTCASACVQNSRRRFLIMYTVQYMYTVWSAGINCQSMV
jgi:hypothetical protein